MTASELGPFNSWLTLPPNAKVVSNAPDEVCIEFPMTIQSAQGLLEGQMTLAGFSGQSFQQTDPATSATYFLSQYQGDDVTPVATIGAGSAPGLSLVSLLLLQPGEQLIMGER